MGRRLYGLGILTVAAAAAVFIGFPDPASGASTDVCPPITIDDLFPPSTEAPEEQPPPTDTTGDITTDTAGADTSTSTSSSSTTTIPEPACRTPFVYPMVFPLLGSGEVFSSFGADRDGGARHHLGNDIAAPSLQPVVAVADGTVTKLGDDEGISGYRIHLRHDDGWSTLYVHLNNDTAGTDDASGIGIRPDLAEGDRVTAGQVIGWNGDSGNAEDSVPHLHFELRDPSGTPVDPAASLAAARRSDLTFSGPFADIEAADSPLTLLLSRGAPTWCDDSGVHACPDEPATASAAADWLAALVGVVDPAPEPDPAPPPEQTLLECGTDGTCPLALSAACEGDGCEAVYVTELDLARAVAWLRLRVAYELRTAWLDPGIPDLLWRTPPPRPPAHPYQLTVEQAYEVLAGRSRCLPIPNSERELTRTEAADRVLAYLGWGPVSGCPTNSPKR
jgi:hypothetical protein